MKEIIKKNLPELLRFASALTGSNTDGEDLIQNAIEKILIKYPDVKDSTEFLKLSYTIIRREYIDIKRKKTKIFNESTGNILFKNTLDLDGTTLNIKTSSIEDKMIENEHVISIREKNKIAQLCLSSLNNENQKLALTLHSEGLKYDEIANRLDIPRGTVMSSLARARMKVAECIKKRLKNEQ
jgi:RNA polymerase sigma factor (sigma-70 family)